MRPGRDRERSGYARTAAALWKRLQTAARFADGRRSDRNPPAQPPTHPRTRAKTKRDPGRGRRPLGAGAVRTHANGKASPGGCRKKLPPGSQGDSQSRPSYRAGFSKSSLASPCRGFSRIPRFARPHCPRHADPLSEFCLRPCADTLDMSDDFRGPEMVEPVRAARPPKGCCPDGLPDGLLGGCSWRVRPGTGGRAARWRGKHPGLGAPASVCGGIGARIGRPVLCDQPLQAAAGGGHSHQDWVISRWSSSHRHGWC